MKNFLRSATAVALLAGIVTTSGTAFGQGAAPVSRDVPHKVGLIDMAHIFKNYKKFEALREDLKTKIQQSEEQMKQMVGALQAKQNEMKALKEGSPEFTAAEQQLAKMTADAETYRRQMQREFLKEESQIYHTVYMEVSDAVSKWATYHKYTLVIRFNREELDTENPQNLIQGMNRQVVWHRDEDDMTTAVLDFLNKQFASQAGGAAAAAPRAATRPAATTPRN